MSNSDKDEKEQLKAIKKALKEFPKIVKQNEARGRSFRKYMKTYQPAVDALKKMLKKQ